MKILHLDSSVTGEKSVSRPLSKTAAEKLKSLQPDAEYVYRDLTKNTLRHYTAVLRLHGDNVEQITPEQKAELETGEEILKEFMSADTVHHLQVRCERPRGALRRQEGHCDLQPRRPVRSRLAV